MDQQTNTKPWAALLILPAGPQRVVAVRHLDDNTIHLPGGQIPADQPVRETLLQLTADQGWDIRIPPLHLDLAHRDIVETEDGPKVVEWYTTSIVPYRRATFSEQGLKEPVTIPITSLANETLMDIAAETCDHAEVDELLRFVSTL